MEHSKLAAELEKVRSYSQELYGGVLEPFERLAQYRPEVLVDWMKLRKDIYEPQDKSGLDFRQMELISTAIEIAAHKPNPDRHAVRAIEAGATVREVADVVSLCIMLGGMMTYMVSGQHALKAAENRAKELGRMDP